MCHTSLILLLNLVAWYITQLDNISAVSLAGGANTLTVNGFEGSIYGNSGIDEFYVGASVSGLTINGVPINDLPSTADDLLACYTDHELEIPVNGIAKASTYDIVIEARYPNKQEQFMGNFLWDYNPQGYTGPEDKILNATMTFVQAEYNII